MRPCSHALEFEAAPNQAGRTESTFSSHLALPATCFLGACAEQLLLLLLPSASAATGTVTAANTLSHFPDTQNPGFSAAHLWPSNKHFLRSLEPHLLIDTTSFHHSLQYPSFFFVRLSNHLGSYSAAKPLPATGTTPPRTAALCHSRPILQARLQVSPLLQRLLHPKIAILCLSLLCSALQPLGRSAGLSTQTATRNSRLK